MWRFQRLLYNDFVVALRVSTFSSAARQEETKAVLIRFYAVMMIRLQLIVGQISGGMITLNILLQTILISS